MEHREPPGRRRPHRALLLAVALGATVVVTSASFALRVPGGKFARTDCYGEFEVEGAAQAPSPPHAAQCTDGDPTCDFDGQCNNSCQFHVALCLNQRDQEPTCTPPVALKKIVIKALAKRLGLQVPPLNSSTCGAFLNVNVPVKVRKKGAKAPGKKRMSVLAIGPARPKIDRSALNLICQPCGGGTTTTTVPGGATCAKNSAGGPDELHFTVLGNGTDLDNGWTGTSHNFPVIKDAGLTYCLSDCDASTNPVCTTNGPTGPGSSNAETFGPPLPLIAGGVAVCVVNRFQTQGAAGITGTLHLDTGESSGNVDLFSDVFVTDSTKVCPRCETGTCDSGAKRGQSCTVDGEVTVVNSLATNKTFKLSKACPPLGQPIATLNIPLRLTTGSVGTPGTGGSKPCTENEAHGVTVQDDNCGAAGCGAPCQPGSDACKTMAPDPTNPASMVCVDAKGGISQVCCNSNPAVPCFPTRTGGPGIVRTGRAVAAQPAWPDPTYPKTVEGEVLVSTFCEAATGSFNVDSVTGLPGPGAVIFNLRMDLLKQP